MSDQDFDLPEGEENITPSDAFSAMEEELNAALPAGSSVITLRHEANAPVYVPVYEGEPGLTIRQACERRGLTLGASVNAYVDNSTVSLDQLVPAGTVVTLVGNVKGGA